MKVTYLKDRNCYVDAAGRVATVTDYGRDFYNCQHDFQDTGKRGETTGSNGKRVPAGAYQCSKCGVFTITEIK